MAEIIKGKGTTTIKMTDADLIGGVYNAGNGKDDVTVTISSAVQAGRVNGGNGKDVLNAQSSTANLTLSGGNGVDQLLGGKGNDKLLGGNGSDTLGGGDGNDMLLGDVAVSATVAGRGQIETLTLSSAYDKGDVITVTFQGTAYSFTVPAAGAVVFDAAAFVAAGGATLANALSGANVTATAAGTVVTFVDADASASAGSFALSASILEVAATRATATYALSELATTEWSVSVNGGPAVVSAQTTAAGSTDAAIQGLVAALNTQASGATFSYDAATNVLTALGPVNGSPLPTIAVAKTTYTTVPGASVPGTAEVTTLVVTRADDGSDAGNKVNGNVVLTSGSLTATISIAVDVADNSQAEKLVAETIRQYINAHPETGLLIDSTPASDGKVVVVWASTGNKTDLAVSFSGTDIVLISTSTVDGVNGTTLPPITTSVTTSITGTETAGVMVSDQGAPVDLVTRTARDAFQQAQSNALDADVLDGGSGSDTFVILHDQTVNMLDLGKFDTIRSFDADADKIQLGFGLASVLSGTRTMSGGSLTAAVNSLFASGGALSGAEATAGAFSYGGAVYLVVANEAGTAFGSDDVIVRLDALTGTLDAGDFTMLAVGDLAMVS